MSSQQNWPPAVPGHSSWAASPGSATRSGPTRNAVFQGLADGRRREVLDALLAHGGERSEPELARAVASSDDGGPSASRAEGPSAGAPEDGVRTARIALRHELLPALEDVGLVEWDRAAASVEAADHPAFRDDVLRRLLSRDDADELFDALADERRRFVLAVLYTYGGTVSLSTVSRKVADLETVQRQSAGEPENLRVSLYHVHFPKLEAAGLVECDRQADQVRYVGHTAVDESWFTF